MNGKQKKNGGKSLEEKKIEEKWNDSENETLKVKQTTREEKRLEKKVIEDRRVTKQEWPLRMREWRKWQRWQTRENGEWRRELRKKKVGWRE